MELNRHFFSEDFLFNKKNMLLLAFLGIFPNVLGLISIPTVFGFRIHIFQYMVFLSALLFGPFGGMVSGGFGSLYTAFALNNPYIIIGNILLGGIFGILIKKGIPIIRAGLFAFAIQVPWLFYTDVYLAGMPQNVVINIVIALLIGNILWLFLAKHSFKRIQGLFQPKSTQF